MADKFTIKEVIKRLDSEMKNNANGSEYEFYRKLKEELEEVLDKNKGDGDE